MKKTPNVGFIRPEVTQLLPLWRKIRDCISGEDTVKAAGELYLPRPNRELKNPEMVHRYREYVLRSVFYNVTRSTLHGLVGQVFAKPPLIKLPAALDELITNSSGTGLSLEQQSKKVLSLTLAYGRAGLHVDYPQTDGPATIADIKSKNLRPTINLYDPGSIINWRVIEDGAEEKLSLVVLYEGSGVFDDGFEIKYAPQYRVLRLDESGEYVQEVWRERGKPSSYDATTYPKRKDFDVSVTYKPLDAAGKPLREIPFSFVGSENNDVNPDLPNLIDIANLNIAHYRNSADYEENAFLMGQSTLFISGVDNEWQEKMEGKIAFGSRAVIMAGPGADGKLIQATANGVHKELMETKERQMVALGARLIEQRQVQRTAYEASSEDASKSSVLASTTRNVNAAYLKALRWAERFASTSVDANLMFELNSNFDISRLSPEQQASSVELWVKGAITFGEMRNVLYTAGTATIEDPNVAASDIKNEQEALMTVPKTMTFEV